jgi:hypothetical protein
VFGQDYHARPSVSSEAYDAGDLDVTERPATVVFGCDGTGTLQNMTWTSWGPTGADGTGTSHQTQCDPSCAEGHQTDYKVVVHAEDVGTAAGKCQVRFRYYKKLVVAYSDQAPPMPDTTVNGMPANEYDITPACAR